MSGNEEIFNLLVIEDDPGEQKLIKIMVSGSGFNCNIKYMNDGEEAINFFDSLQAEEDGIEKFNLIFLDLNLLKINGIEVLKKIKQTPLLKNIPVVVLTTSNNKKDINMAYEAGASGYIRKPTTAEEYEKSIKIILQYWFEVCILA
jgi:CheY-like chemotaxis protein